MCVRHCEMWVQLGLFAGVASLRIDTAVKHPGNEIFTAAFSAYLPRGSEVQITYVLIAVFCKAFCAACLR